MHSGVRNDWFSIRATDKIFNILRDGRDSESVFSRSFDKTEKKVRRNIVLEHNPRFITDEKSLFFYRSHLGPNEIKHIKHRRGFQSFFYITDTKDRKRIIDVNICVIVEEFSEGSSYIFTELEGDLLSSLHPIQNIHQIFHQRRKFPRVVVHFKCEAFQGVSILECFIKESFFFWTKFSN
mgnify:CR=1 FL=1